MMFDTHERETCYPLTFGHRPYIFAAKPPPQPRTLNLEPDTTIPIHSIPEVMYEL